MSSARTRGERRNVARECDFKVQHSMWSLSGKVHNKGNTPERPSNLHSEADTSGFT